MMNDPEETQYLTMITEKLGEALTETNRIIERYEKEYKDALIYLWEYKSEFLLLHNNVNTITI